ncbi:hypothetical protein D9757_001515 [Collybiopsis confluens]|uniref:BZIP domain-containing protein n=1 Tax=Collybiopsis confluens TaxID=2823264 RepID=A0A8H5HZK1_9AGAR|nr:hypothetical protein D9757_001515 [Collybiopsis confluens]
MSSKRGRKRNDNLPPNRARDVQRAFRARRAAHLQALEERVAELEEENSHLRQALNLPPASRPALGKGPTGKDKPKSFESPDSSSTYIKSRESSGSPPSTRLSSHSPENSPAVRIDDPVWDQAIVMADGTSDIPNTSSASPYALPSMSGPTSSKPMSQYNPYPNSAPRTSTMSVPMYINSQTSYSHSSDRSMSSSYPSPTFPPLHMDQRDESRAHYSYSPPFDSHLQHDTSPPSSMHIHSQLDASLPYPNRRSHTEPHVPYSIDSSYHLANSMSHSGIRLPSPPRLQDGGGEHHSQLSAPRHVFNTVSDGRAPSIA